MADGVEEVNEISEHFEAVHIQVQVQILLFLLLQEPCLNNLPFNIRKYT